MPFWMLPLSSGSMASRAACESRRGNKERNGWKQAFETKHILAAHERMQQCLEQPDKHKPLHARRYRSQHNLQQKTCTEVPAQDAAHLFEVIHVPQGQHLGHSVGAQQHLARKEGHVWDNLRDWDSWISLERKKQQWHCTAHSEVDANGLSNSLRKQGKTTAYTLTSDCTYAHS